MVEKDVRDSILARNVRKKGETMEAIKVDADLVALCGLYCGACRSYKKGKCPGCRQNNKATWCKTRTCGLEKGFGSCADCDLFADPGKECRKLNNPVAWVFSLLFNSNRAACLRRIRAVGRTDYAKEMATLGRQSLPRSTKETL